MKVQNKVMVVTGGGNGIGRELVLLLLKKGAKVAALDISEKSLQETAALAGPLAPNLSRHVVNIVDRAAVEALPDAVIAAHGAVDGLINCAGIIQRFVRFNELTYADIERVIDVNLYGTINTTKAFLPHLLKRPEAHIANVSSMGGFLPVPGQTLYGASKAAVKLFTEGLNSELVGTPVHVTIIFPGAIKTNIAGNSGLTSLKMDADKHGNFKMTLPDVAAQVIVDAVENNRQRVMVGSDAKLMDFLSRLMPVGAAGFIRKQMGALLSR